MNHKRKKIFLILLLVVCGTFCFGEQISFQIVEHNNSVEEVTDSALCIEDALIDNFFEQGYIVTNSLATVSRDEAGDRKLWTTGMQEALDGGADYFVQVVLHFAEKKGKEPFKDIMILKEVEYTFTLVNSSKIKEKASWKCDIDVFEAEDLKDPADKLINEITKVIKA